MADSVIRKVKYPIAFKLITIISILVVFSLGTITALITVFISADVQLTAEQNNHTINAQASAAAEKELSSVRANVYLLMDMLRAAGPQTVLGQQASDLFFERNQDVVAIVTASSTGLSSLELVNTRYFISNATDESVLRTFLDSSSEAITRASMGETLAINAAPFFQLPLLALMYPWQDAGQNESLIVVFSSETLTETFGSGTTNSSFMINDRNELLVDSDFEMIKSNANMSNLPLVQQMRESNDENRQVVFTDESGTKFFGAYTKLPIGDIGVITTIESALVLEGVNASVTQNLLLAFVVLCLTVMFVWFFSKSISKPVKILAAASEQIEKGEYELDLKPRTKDELGVLTERFVSMGKGLAERERLKDTFGRFINKEIAEQAMKGELKLGGETKQTTIFFSDIRSFTAISEKLEPDEVVEFLNDYMTRMVKCVNDTNGVVDKFIGDAVMAVWGAPVSAGTPAEDALNCVRAALMMRSALIDFNKGRGGDKKPIIKIGCGINTGPVVAGQIGSNERMEYTVIGDAVNLASRAETLNKPFGTDILITENTFNLIKKHVLVAKMPSVTVKGKEKPISMFAVVNMPNATDISGAGRKGPRKLADVRNLLGIEAPNFAKVNVDAEEKKYEIGK